MLGRLEGSEDKTHLVIILFYIKRVWDDILAKN